mmetsp:Transcript_52541/g.125498  ORF Transcript_52541/g.125498 Transcript_52541/m.125498 type:complete len:312 (+) Transcript_52541:82-1017(+)
MPSFLPTLGSMLNKKSQLALQKGEGSAEMSRSLSSGGKLMVIPHQKLFISEPDPRFFGNERNPSKAKKGWTNENWLKSRFHFSFAEYTGGPSNFGVLRVMNDDLVQPLRGFGTHPHRDMEIITFVVEGQLTHQDSMGTKETLGRGSIQFMTAGSGVRHSEHNFQKAAPLRFIQSWVVPRQRGLTPNYGSYNGTGQASAEARRDKWLHLVADVRADRSVTAPVRINQDCNVYVTELSPGANAPSLKIGEHRQAYMLCVEGDVVKGLQKKQLRRHDAAELKGPLALDLEAGPDGALVLLFEMAMTDDSRGIYH